MATAEPLYGEKELRTDVDGELEKAHPAHVSDVEDPSIHPTYTNASKIEVTPELAALRRKITYVPLANQQTCPMANEQRADGKSISVSSQSWD
jgi:hypothetical protein